MRRSLLGFCALAVLLCSPAFAKDSPSQTLNYGWYPHFVDDGAPFRDAPRNFTSVPDAVPDVPQAPMRAKAQSATADYWKKKYTPSQLKREACKINADYNAEEFSEARWTKPVVTVRIAAKSRKQPGFKPKVHIAFVEQALAAWSEATDGKLKFKLVKDNEPADIHVLFDCNRHPLAGKDKCGLTWRSTVINGPDLEAADVLIMLKDAHGTFYDDRQNEYTVYHELGHAMGLQHSADAGDIMYEAGHRASLSLRDRNTMRKRYGLPLEDSLAVGTR